MTQHRRTLHRSTYLAATTLMFRMAGSSTAETAEDLSEEADQALPTLHEIRPVADDHPVDLNPEGCLVV